jgi:purine-binding chemotaxis protein CheW
MNGVHLVCFRIGKETYGVDISTVREIVRVEEITRVPGTPEFMLGVVNLRGRILSVVDLGHRLGLTPSTVTGSSRILVAQLDGVTVGFLVDAATAVARISGDQVEPPPVFTGSIDVDYLEGVAKSKNELIIILNLNKVLGSGQVAAVAAAANGAMVPTEPI